MFYIKLFSISPTNIKVAAQEVARNSPALLSPNLRKPRVVVVVVVLFSS